MTSFLPFVLFFCVLCLDCVLPHTLLADYYKYTDNRGVAHITNKIDAVPAKYRSTMKVTREEPPKRDAAARVQVEQSSPGEAARQEATAPEPAPGKFRELASRFPWFKPLVYLFAGIALFTVVLKVTSLLSSPQLSKAICISFFLGVLVFLYKSYVGYIVESSAKVKDATVSMMKKSAARELPPEVASPPAPGEGSSPQQR